MRVEGGKRLSDKLRKLPKSSGAHIKTAVRRNTEEGERIVRLLAPDVTGETRGNITTAYHDDGMTGEVIVIASRAPRADKDRAYSIEFGRDGGPTGAMDGFGHVKQAKLYLAKRWKGRLARAIRKAVKEVAGNV